MPRTTAIWNISLPPEMAKEAETVAKKESRTNRNWYVRRWDNTYGAPSGGISRHTARKRLVNWGFGRRMWNG